jgi:hypothetical protein
MSGGAVLLLWANKFSPFRTNRQKRRILRALQFSYFGGPIFSPFGKRNISEGLYQLEVDK